MPKSHLLSSLIVARQLVTENPFSTRVHPSNRVVPSAKPLDTRPCASQSQHQHLNMRRNSVGNYLIHCCYRKETSAQQHLCIPKNSMIDQPNVRSSILWTALRSSRSQLRAGARWGRGGGPGAPWGLRLYTMQANQDARFVWLTLAL